jgi:hypothetical protein
MSAQGDPFRDLVKQNINLYRANEEALKEIEEVKLREYQEWKLGHEVYEKAKAALELTEKLTKKNEKVVDRSSKTM